MATTLSAALIIFIALIHSVLGEVGILKPLFSAEWETDVPRYAMERILRFAWHLTSFAWVALGATALGVPILDALGACALLSGAVIFIMLRGHLAWPLFLLSGGAALLSQGRVPHEVFSAMAIAAASLSLIISGVHVYWALGGKRGIYDVIPSAPSDKTDAELAAERAANPGPLASTGMTLATFGVAGALLVMGALLVAPLLGVEHALIEWGLIAAAIVLGLRCMGDGKYVGLTKQVRTTRFARLDDALYTPLVFSLATGCVSALLIHTGALA